MSEEQQQQQHLDRISVIASHLVSGGAQQHKADVSSAFDYYHLDDLLNDSQRQTREQAKTFARDHLLPIVNEYYEKAEFPMHVIPLLAKLNWAGSSIKGYGCPGLDAVSSGLISMELAKASTDIAVFFSILQTIAMLPISVCGSEEQKQRYLPGMAAMNLIGCFSLTEPMAGSDAAGLFCQARQLSNGAWLLNGEKRWIGSAPMADVNIIWARNVDNNQIHGFIIDKGTDGMTVETIKNKIALRSVQNGHIYLNDCLVQEANRLPLAKDFATGPGKCLFLTRIIASWIALGIAIGAYESCLQYVKRRKQFGSPLARYQLVQDKLVRMLGNIQAMAMMTMRVSQLYDKSQLTYGQVGLLKAHNTSRGREVVSMARELVGGNGIVTDYGVARSFVDMEAVHTFEGTYEINALIAGREITGHSAFKS
ncbi:hypothetical protein SAMD00019534_007030 [Acytostelium subglobosum LB1]|uniref:hypothetical protein n=1 Tax=Acytostelium subglobosum LB1 TaxID=1410327 RepID=UPI0006447FB5|nr:hypothetical protein SAMD00019534_007030 [Acytostelium subglobosum LB1]GAM17528.1 hypothetical protein SAMD00019534_007030 [Acytostelium subglobosum LB1]|eukprot:XP_012759590.1 hypothetical protein SAMD00019534_007030 [Acytostelium subglobosum LB1]